MQRGGGIVFALCSKIQIENLLFVHILVNRTQGASGKIARTFLYPEREIFLFFFLQVLHLAIFLRRAEKKNKQKSLEHTLLVACLLFFEKEKRKSVYFFLIRKKKKKDKDFFFFTEPRNNNGSCGIIASFERSASK